MDAPAPATVRPPRDLDALDPAAQILVWAFRRWIGGHARRDSREWLLVVRELSRQSGSPRGLDAAGALAALVRVLCGCARRTFTYHQPCCPCLSTDEYRLVRLVAACHDHDWQVARMLAEWIVVGDGVGDLVAAASRLSVAIRPDPVPERSVH